MTLIPCKILEKNILFYFSYNLCFYKRDIYAEFLSTDKKITLMIEILINYIIMRKNYIEKNILIN